ncbi:hypothetical protein FRB99_002269 [Tulasnella sp. 403]|nr:hypothetical protein FRB99_002269 [Tulasnella sp. 403]
MHQADSSPSPAEQWLDISDEEITVKDIDELLPEIPDDLWVVTACFDRVVDDVELQEHITQVGLSRTETALKEAQKVISLSSPLAGDEDEDDERPPPEFEFDDDTPQILALRKALFKRLDAIKTYSMMSLEGQWTSPKPEEGPLETLGEEEDLDLDPWADTGETESATTASQAPASAPPPPFTLSSFLYTPLVTSALLLASSLQFGALRILLSRHHSVLFPHRYRILDTIPLYVYPTEFSQILPSFDYAQSVEKVQQTTSPREAPDWVETEAAQRITEQAPTSIPEPWDVGPASYTQPNPLSAEELSAWYIKRVNDVDANLGLVDVSLALVQHGASEGIPGLDELGEELSLLSRLVYDTSSNGAQPADWTLSRWRCMDSESIVASYLSLSTPQTIADDIRRLVLPYLYVLEARQERTGAPDPDIPNRHLYRYILRAPLPVVAAIFQASKPTLRVDQRIIKKDEDMIRLALACLYGSDSLDQWTTMTQIFECLPAWQDLGKEEEYEGDAADETLRSMATFIAPSASRPVAAAEELMIFFNPLPPRSLSRALDILDVHLDSGETFSRWNVPAPLRWFLQSAGDEGQQRAWATRMARRNATGDSVEDDEEWINLMKDMVRLAKGKDELMRGAFGLLSKEQVKKIFFEGLLSLGKFQLAKRLLNPKRGHRPLTDDVVEELCLTISREFYDNAPSGNLYVGEMKQAYECLLVALPSPAITAEREFIEATSKICSYGVQSRPGVPLAPIEIRLVKDRLSLVARVLSSNGDLYKHTEVVMDIVRKLGFQGDVAAEVKALAMLADAATQAEDFVRAAETCERMVKTVKELRRTVLEPNSNESLPDEAKVRAANEAVEVCWHTCFQLGRQPEFPDVKRKLALLGYAMQLCPSENVLDVLAVWRRIEGEALQSQESRTRSRGGRASERLKTRQSKMAGGVSALSAAAGRLPSLSAHLLSMPNTPSLPITSDAAAAMASRTFNRMAGVAAQLPSNLPFSLRGRLRDEDGSGGVKQSPNSDVSQQAKAAFARGVGWLIGADE